MNNNKPRRRWFQFRLRSVLLLMLVVGLWLGYEVNWARRQQRHVAAIEELGGSVEYEPYRGSLLRFCDPKKYGRTVAKAKISSTRVADAKPHLEGLSHLRRLAVAYDGTCDLHPHLDRLRSTYPNVDVVPVGMTLHWKDLKRSEWPQLHQRARGIHARLRRSVLRNGLDPPCGCDSEEAKAAFDEHRQWLLAPFPAMDVNWGFTRIELCIVPLPDRSMGEIIIESGAVSTGGYGPGDFASAVFLVRDRIVDIHPRRIGVAPGSIHLDDVNGDGSIDLICQGNWGDLEVYRIDSQGFHLMRGLSKNEKQRATQGPSLGAR